MVGIQVQYRVIPSDFVAKLFPAFRADARFGPAALTDVSASEISFGSQVDIDESGPDRKKSARILIADDHEAVRRGLRSALIAAGWEVCGEASNGREAISRTLELQPDLILLDVSMPLMGGLEAAPRILRSAPKVKVVVFTMHESREMRNVMTNIGVHGVAIKSAPLASLLDTIKRVLGK